jgi:YD repeat-containing protein
MKKFFGIFVFLFCVVCYAFDHAYDVSGEDENSVSLEGTVYSNNGERAVTGELTDEDGNTHEFYGEWDGYGQISGETDDGVTVYLSTK